MAGQGKEKTPKKGRELIKRIISTVILLPVLVFLIHEGGYYFKGLLAILALLMAYEYERLTKLPKKSRGVLTAGIFGSVFWVMTTITAEPMVDGAVIVVIFGFVIYEIGVILNKIQMKWAGFGISYIGLPIFALGFIELSTNGPLWIYWLLAVIWGCDSGAYGLGKLVGGPKLAPRISPNKTWAGFGGGILAGAACGAVAALLFHLGDPFFLAFMGALLATWGQIGDLVESFIKRSFKVKDSGYLIPGHGGILDRTDALIFAAPMVAFGLWVAG